MSPGGDIFAVAFSIYLYTYSIFFSFVAVDFSPDSSLGISLDRCMAREDNHWNIGLMACLSLGTLRESS